MDWTVLGIEPTKDKKAITGAYRARLTAVNPEDKPEEFKALRAAYEEAQALADQGEEPTVRDGSPVGQWMERVRALYGDYRSRIRPEAWRELLADEVCLALDQSPLAEEALLRFLMEDFYIPQSVWQALDEAFSWSERREELYEHYARDFVDYAVLNGIRCPDSLPYGLFLPGENGADCDQYRRLYYQASRAAQEEVGPILEQMNALSEEHPYGHALNGRFLIENGREEQGREILRQLAEAYPDEIPLAMSWAAQCAQEEDWAACEGLTRHVLDLNPDHGQAKRMLADALAGTGRYEESKDLIFELMHAAGGDRKEIYQLDQMVQELNQALIGQWEEKLAQDPEDGKTALELGWCYLQNDRADDALAICRKVDPNYEDQYDYHHLYAKVQYACQDFEGALVHLQAVEDILTHLEPDGTDETEKRRKRLPEFLQMAGSCLYALDRREETRAKFEQALSLAPDDPEILTQMSRLLVAEKNFDRAAEVLTRLTDRMPDSYHGYFLLAQTLYELRRDREAFDAVNRALELDGSDLGVYVLKMRILLRNGVFDGVRDILDFVHQNGITDDLSVMWCEAQLAEFEGEDKQLALGLYEAIAKRLEEGEHLAWAAQVYFRITVLLAEERDARKKEDRAELMAILDKGLEQDENDIDCMDYKAWLLKRDNRVEEAIALYHRLEAMPRRSLNVERELAELYYKDLTSNADKSLRYYKMLLDHEESPVDHFYAGFCCRYTGDQGEAERHFLRVREMDPNDVDAYRGLAYVYEAMGRYEEALENAEKAIELRKDLEGDQSQWYFRKLQILRRLGRVQEAIRTVDEVAEKYGYDSAERMKFDVYCQFGLWGDAQRHLDDWKKSRQKRTMQYSAQIKLYQLMGRYDEVRAALAKGARKFNPTQYQSLRLSMDELDGDTAAQFRDWEERRGSDGTFNDYALMNLAQANWWAGDCDRARDYARQALEKEDEYLTCFVKNEALLRGRRCILLAILGREEEAVAELAKVRALPLCETCEYGACKDADICEAQIAEIFGRYQRARELYQAGQERWPDDTDFAAGIRRLKRKGF